MKIVQSKLRLIVADREIKERSKLGIRAIAKEAGASVSSVQGLLNNTLKRIPVEDLGALCRYFGCDVGDILTMQDEGQ